MYSRYKGAIAPAGRCAGADSSPPQPPAWRGVDAELRVCGYPGLSPSGIPRFLKKEPQWRDSAELRGPHPRAAFELRVSNATGRPVLCMATGVMGGRPLRRLYAASGAPLDTAAPIALLPGSDEMFYAVAFYPANPAAYRNTVTLYPVAGGGLLEPAAIVSATVWVAGA